MASFLTLFFLSFEEKKHAHVLALDADITRAVVARQNLFSCCCGCVRCCLRDTFSLSTDSLFELSPDGEEAYVIKEIFGVDGEELHEKSVPPSFPLFFSHLCTHSVHHGQPPPRAGARTFPPCCP